MVLHRKRNNKQRGGKEKQAEEHLIDRELNEKKRERKRKTVTMVLKSSKQGMYVQEIENGVFS